MSRSSSRWSAIAHSLVCGLASLASALGLSAAEFRPGFQDRVFRDEAGEHKYVLFVPKGYTPERRWPLILYLHGSSARGTDNKLPLVGGLAPQVRARADTFPFIVVFPQCEDRDTRLLDGWLASTDDATRALKIVDDVEHDLSVDRDHEVLTGWSMGGAGAWSIGAETASRWSAMVIVAGSGDPSTAPRMTNVPIWAFHGTRDFTVSFDQGRQMVDAVREAGGRAYFTELTGVRHNIAHVIYGEDSLYQWMLDPSSTPKPEGFVRNAKRIPNEAEMGHDFVHPFVPAAEIPQALYVRMDKDAIESLGYALPGLVPPGAIEGVSSDVHQTQRSFLTRFNVTLSGINYRGTLERIQVTTHKDGWATVALGLRNMTTQIGSTQINGRVMSASAGPMEIVLGHQRPVWLSVRVRPYIAEKRIHMELGETHFEIPDDNWYVTTPQVSTRGVPLLGRRVSNAISSKLVAGTYSRKGEIESQVVQSAPMLVQKLEEQLDQALSKTRTVGSWPMPAYQPPFRLWPDRMHVDESGLSLIVGITVGRPALDTDTRPVKRIERPPIKFEEMPKTSGLQFGIAGAFLEGFTSVVVDAGVAMADALDLHTPAFRELGDRSVVIDAVPDLARFGERLQVRTRLQSLEPMYFGAPIGDRAERSNEQGVRVAQSAVQLRMPHVRLTFDVKTSPDQKNWQRCAEFDVRLSQRIELQLQEPTFEKRVLRMQRPEEAEIAVTGRFADGYEAVDNELRIDRMAARFRNAWRAAEQMELLQQMSASDLLVGTANLRVAEVGWTEPFLMRRYTPAATRITNGTDQTVSYRVRGPYTEWSEPYTLEAGKGHDFKVTYPLTIREIKPSEKQAHLLPMGTNFIVGQAADSSNRSATASNPTDTDRSN